MVDVVVPAIEQAIKNTAQSSARRDAGLGGNVFLVNWFAKSGQYIPAWWSRARDAKLRQFWKESDHLSGALYAMVSKMQAIPIKVVPRDMSVKSQVARAQEVTDILVGSAQFGAGWEEFYGLFVEDLLTQDNGAFAEIIAPGDKTKPVIGQPISVAHLDSYRCTRTGNPVYPVIYDDTDGNRYKLHYTRVMHISQMTSPIADMNGVGFCAISRCVNVAQTLIDILVYKQEKLGSRPHRQLIITRGGLDPHDLQEAFSLAEERLDAHGLTRYSKVVVGGSQTLPEADLKVVELSSLPDGFDEQTYVTLGMATIALAFGVDARELFPALTSGATRADALLQHLKQRGKGPGQILQVTERLFNYKFLPEFLMFQSDFQDDAQDRQSAEIRLVRANRRVQDASTQSASQRVLREQMLRDGDIDASQFERMELEDGRLGNGDPTVSLFYSKQERYRALLELGVENPLDVHRNNHQEMLRRITDKRLEVYEILANSNNEETRWMALRAEAALNALEVMYLPEQAEEDSVSVHAVKPQRADDERFGGTNLPPLEQSNGGGRIGNMKRENLPGNRKRPGHNYIDPRVRRVDATVPNMEANLGGALEYDEV